jgi:hypothetical protein
MGVLGAILGPMSATGEADAAENDKDEEEAHPARTALRLIVGWLCVAISVLNLTDEIGRPSGVSDVPYLIFHAVVLVGGMVLLALEWIGPKPGTAGYVAAGVVTGAGMIFSALSVRHGYPFGFLVRNEGAAGRWHVDTPHAIADVIFWAYLGLMVLVVVSLLRRARKTRQAPEQPADQEERQYIERRGHAGEQAHQKTVGPLP